MSKRRYIRLPQEYMDGMCHLGLPMKLWPKCPDCGVNIEIHAHPEDSDYDITDEDIIAWSRELFDDDEDTNIIGMRMAFFEDSDVEFTCGCPKCGKDFPVPEDSDSDEEKE